VQPISSADEALITPLSYGPNPVSDKLYIAFNKEEVPERMYLYDLNGILQKEWILDDIASTVENQYILDMNNIYSGVYILYLEQNDKTGQIQIVRAR
jgi:hypothetical protein